jgi:hypothetical protein
MRRCRVTADVKVSGRPVPAPERPDAAGQGSDGSSGSRLWWSLAAGVAVLTVAVVAAGVHWRSGTPTPGAGHRFGAGSAPTGGASAAASQPASTGRPSGVPGRTSVYFSFDGGPGQPELALRSAAGGRVTGVPHGGGTALAFPAPCPQYGAAHCPRAVLEAPGGDLSPGGQPLRWGATVLLTGAQATPGSNIVQKGTSLGGGQFKLQVDGVAGYPSCVLVDSAPGSRIQVAKAAVSIADGAWHEVVCDRNGPLLTVSIDGHQRGVTSIPPGLSVTNADTLRIGGKGTAPNNDQFSGVLDDVFVDIGP